MHPDPMPCGLCGRSFERSGLTRHHCLPRAEGGQIQDIALICRQCHSTVHALYSNETLAAVYPTITQLRSAPDLQGYIRWVRRQPTTRHKANRPRRRKL